MKSHYNFQLPLQFDQKLLQNLEFGKNLGKMWGGRNSKTASKQLWLQCGRLMLKHLDFFSNKKDRKRR
jgi:hypothetical protein